MHPGPASRQSVNGKAPKDGLAGPELTEDSQRRPNLRKIL